MKLTETKEKEKRENCLRDESQFLRFDESFIGLNHQTPISCSN
jgi:hypothetical protein